jgi:hypothetical protein
LELDGRLAGVVSGFKGGNAVADVIEFSSGDDLISSKSLGDIHYEEIVIVTGFAMDAILWDWVAHMLDGTPVRMDGAIVFADVNLNVVRRLEFHNALLTEVAFPELDASDQDVAHLTIKFRPEWTEQMAGSGKLADSFLTRQKAWLTSNFRIEVGSLACQRVNKIEALTIKQKVTEFREGGERTVQLVPGKLEVPNVVLTFSVIDGSSWEPFFDDFVIHGNNGADKELGGILQFLGPDLSILASLHFLHVGIFRLAPEEADPSTAGAARLQADLYVESNRLFVGGLN